MVPEKAVEELSVPAVKVAAVAELSMTEPAPASEPMF